MEKRNISTRRQQKQGEESAKAYTSRGNKFSWRVILLPWWGGVSTGSLLGGCNERGLNRGEIFYQRNLVCNRHALRCPEWQSLAFVSPIFLLKLWKPQSSHMEIFINFQYGGPCHYFFTGPQILSLMPRGLQILLLVSQGPMQNDNY